MINDLKDSLMEHLGAPTDVPASRRLGVGPLLELDTERPLDVSELVRRIRASTTAGPSSG